MFCRATPSSSWVGAGAVAVVVLPVVIHARGLRHDSLVFFFCFVQQTMAASVTVSTSLSLSAPTPFDIARYDRQREQRLKQIAYGKQTVGYANYTRHVPHDRRDAELRDTTHPVTPRVDGYVSKRHWDAQLRRWRRALHTWDQPPADAVEGLGGADVDAYSVCGPTAPSSPQMHRMPTRRAVGVTRDGDIVIVEPHRQH